MAKASLTAVIGISTSAFTKGIKGIQNTVQSLTSSVTAKVAGLGVALGAGFSIAGFVQGIRQAIQFGDQIEEMHRATGIAHEDLSRLAHAGKQAGANFGSVAFGLSMLTVYLADADKGATKIEKSFADLGMDKAAREGKSLTEILAGMADGYKALVDAGKGGEALDALRGTIGRGAFELRPLFAEGSKGIKESIREADRLGITIGAKTGIAFKKVADSILRFQSAMKGAFISIASELAPVIDSIANFLTDRLTGDKTKSTIRTFATFLANALLVGAKGAIDVGTAIYEIGIRFQQVFIYAQALWRELKNGSQSASTFLVTAFSELGNVLAGLTRLGASAFKRMANTLVEAFKAVAPILAQVIGTAIGSIEDSIGNLYSRAKLTLLSSSFGIKNDQRNEWIEKRSKAEPGGMKWNYYNTLIADADGKMNTLARLMEDEEKAIEKRLHEGKAAQRGKQAFEITERLVKPIASPFQIETNTEFAERQLSDIEALAIQVGKAIADATARGDDEAVQAFKARLAELAELKTKFTAAQNSPDANQPVELLDEFNQTLDLIHNSLRRLKTEMRFGGVLNPDESKKWDELQAKIEKVRETNRKLKEDLQGGVDRFKDGLNQLPELKPKPMITDLAPVGALATVANLQAFHRAGVQHFRNSMATGLQATRNLHGPLTDPAKAATARLPESSWALGIGRIITSAQDEVAVFAGRTADATESMDSKLDDMIDAVAGIKGGRF